MARSKKSKVSGRGGIPTVPKPAATVGTVARPAVGPPGPTTK